MSVQSYFDEKNIILDDGQEKALKALNSLSLESKKNWNPFSKKEMGEGVYLYGDVGRGKTMVMDAYFEALPTTIPKMRVHFHAFMKQVHEFLHEYRQNNKDESGVDRALPEFVESFSGDMKLICFDEFHIVDVADAMILSRLFTAILERGINVVMTSNWHPDSLYEGGLQRDRILPFIALIKKQMQIVALDGDIDYRKQVLKGEPVYFTPPYDGFDKVVTGLIDGKECLPVTLSVKGREIVIAEAYGDVAILSFAMLCGEARGAEDYLAIAQNFSVLVIKDIPNLSQEQRNEAKRLMTLIDVLYEAETITVICAQSDPYGLYTGEDHAKEFDRTISRLIEMQGADYISRG